MIVIIRFIFIYFLFLIMGDFRIASLNINGARNPLKRAQLHLLSRIKRLDVLLLQETHSDARNAADWALEWEGLSLLSHNSNVSGGVACLFSKSFTPISYEVVEVIEGRLMKVRACFENYVFVFVCVYAPTTAAERVAFLETLSTVISGCNGDEYLFIGGDFNCTEQDIDRNHVEPHMLSRSIIRQCMQTHDLSDVWRNFHNGQKQYTWTHVRSNMISLARLDRVYCFKHHLNMFKSCDITPVSFSDHSLVVCSVFLNSVKPKSAYWHFNTTLTHDKDFRDVFKAFWVEFCECKTTFSSLQQWWDFGKMQIQQLCKQYSRNITSDRTRSIEILEAELVEFQNLAYSTGDNDDIDNLATKKGALAELLGLNAQGALVRSRFQCVDQMDVPSKFFFSLEKKNGQRKCIHSLKSESGTLLTSVHDIRSRAARFYEDLYRSELSGEQADSVFMEGLPQVSAESLAELDSALTLEELERALQGMECGKAPGLDGISIDFYKSFWSVVGEDVLAVLNDSLAGGLLPVSCRRAVLTLLPKKGDLTDIKCWRPVSLLCSDYKLLSKALANRLCRVIDQVIHPDQTYCIPSRSIFDNVALVRDVIDMAKMLGLDVGLVSLDQEKAFDRVEHSYLWDTLYAFGFSEGFIQKVKVLYSDVESILKINGGLSAPFKVGRGVRQGCPLSGMLYSLAIEPLLQRLRITLRGVSVPGCVVPLRVSAYADDIVLLISGGRDIEMVVDILKEFGLLSSAKVNWAKSEALLLGQWVEGVPRLPDNLSWRKDGFKYLGVFLGNDVVMGRNWEGAVESVKGRLEKWKWLLSKMSYRGRVLIINNLVASSFWHRLACVDPPPDLLQKIQSVLGNFFWDGLHWVPQSVLFLPKDEGGQGLIHLQSRTAAFRLQFVKRLLTGPTYVAWRGLSCAILKMGGSLGLDKSLFLMKPDEMLFSKLPPFYRSCFKVWALFKVRWFDPAISLHWLLQEPVVGGARLDVSSANSPSLQKMLCGAKIVTLKDVVDLTGPYFGNRRGLADSLGLRSLRVVSQLLEKWRAACTTDETELLVDYCAGVCRPDKQDLFPGLVVWPNLDGCTGPLLSRNPNTMLLSMVTGKQWYQACVKVFNKKSLESRVDTPWSAALKLNSGVRPEWRALYKPPLAKRVCDLQWRILHGAVAVNAFVSVINRNVSQECPFCYQRETVFHAFTLCLRLEPLFCMLKDVFGAFSEDFSTETFVLGFKYVKKRQNVCKILNFILGQAKMAIYITRRNKVEQQPGTNVIALFPALVKARVLVDFRFYELMQNLETFKDVWCVKEAICTVKENELHFSHIL